MPWNRRRHVQRSRSSYRERYDRGAAADELAELEALLASGGEAGQESLGVVWRSRIAGWGADSGRRARGRELLAEGAVRGLRVEVGRIAAEVVGSETYQVQIVVRPPSRWEIEAMRRQLLTPPLARHPGALTGDAMLLLDALVRTMVVSCTCPDGWGCKHAFAALLAFGARLEAEPTALLVLWGAAEPVPEGPFVPTPLAAGKVALTGDLAALFGIVLVEPPEREPSEP